MIYYGAIDKLRQARYSMASAYDNDYAMFAGGGSYNNAYSKALDCYDGNLTKNNNLNTLNTAAAEDTISGGVGQGYYLFNYVNASVGIGQRVIDVYATQSLAHSSLQQSSTATGYVGIKNTICVVNKNLTNSVWTVTNSSQFKICSFPELIWTTRWKSIAEA